MKIIVVCIFNSFIYKMIDMRDNRVYFIIYPADHQFAVQDVYGHIIKTFDGVTFTYVRNWLENFRNGNIGVQLDLFV